MSIVNLVFKALDGCDKLLRRSADKAYNKVNANRVKQSDLLLTHSARIVKLEEAIAQEESRYAESAMELSFKNVELNKRAARELKLAGFITKLIKEDNV